MKNIFAYILGFLMVSMLFAGTNVWAAQTLSGADTLADGGDGPGFSVQLSPGVSVGYNGITSAFEICGVNENGTVEYGTASSVQGIYMHVATITDGVPVLTTLTTTTGATFDSWTLMGGS